MTRIEIEKWVNDLTTEETVTLAEVALNEISNADALNVMFEWAGANGASDQLLDALEGE